MTRVAVDVYGSLSLTGKGHHTDIAIIMGLAGNQPDTVDIDAIPAFIRDVEARGRLLLANGQHEVDFPADDGMRFRSDNLPLHENGMTIHASGRRERDLLQDLLLDRRRLYCRRRALRQGKRQRTAGALPI